MGTVFAHEGKYPKHVVPEAWTYFNRKFGVKRGLLFMWVCQIEILSTFIFNIKIRDDEEWYIYRQILNKLMLKDYKWTEPLIEKACDNFIENLKKLVGDSDEFVEIPDLEQKLGRWTIDVVMNIMLGHSYSPEDNPQLHGILEEFSAVSQEIFESSANLMNIPTSFADKFQLKAWKKFEKVAHKSILMCK